MSDFPLVFVFPLTFNTCLSFSWLLKIAKTYDDFQLIFFGFDFVFPLDFFFLFFFADQLNANDKLSRSNSRKLIRNNSLTRVHSHTDTLTQSASSSVTSLTASNETIKSNVNNKSTYAKSSRKKRGRKRRRK